jgi:hypothetical protein
MPLDLESITTLGGERQPWLCEGGRWRQLGHSIVTGKLRDPAIVIGMADQWAGFMGPIVASHRDPGLL